LLPRLGQFETNSNDQNRRKFKTDLSKSVRVSVICVLDFGFVSNCRNDTGQQEVVEFRISSFLLTMAHGKHKPKQEEESGEGAPLWIISFADMMSLLMAFFVMLSTFSGFGPSEAEQLQKAVKATLGGSYHGGWHQQRSRTAVGYQSPAAGQPGKGSEKPTLQDGEGRGLMKETQAGDFRKRKVFLIESSQVFWGNGTTLSPGGRDFLNALATYVGKVPGRLVITENGPADGGEDREAAVEGVARDAERQTSDETSFATDFRPTTQDPEEETAGTAPGPAKRNPSSQELGLLRALTALNYLTTRGVPKDRCSIATCAMSPEHGFQTERVLEVVLLDASVYE
jgi:outer membrane protein OmpA-like peptidoglycan-associated protein